ncbi:MAG: hypothetical protein II980_04990 [Clostridia bacterium]|nr:hypothetical protein [Clostridia bacterium]
MAFYDTLMKWEQKHLDEGNSEFTIEVDCFIYTYKIGATRVPYNGRDYICLENKGHYMFEVRTKEVREQYEQEYHVYLVDFIPYYIKNEAIRSAVTKLYKKQLENYKEISNGFNVISMAGCNECEEISLEIDIDIDTSDELEWW